MHRSRRRRLFLEKLAAAHAEGRLAFFGDLARLADRAAFAARLAPLRRAEWVVYAKRPFAGPESVLAYLARYTHRVAISSSRLVAMDDRGVTFRWKDYRQDGQARRKEMTLAPGEFIRRFLIHVLPSGFHRIRHYGLFANPARAANLVKASALLHAPPPSPVATNAEPQTDAKPPIACPCCGGRMILVEIFERAGPPHSAPLKSPQAATAIPRVRLRAFSDTRPRGQPRRRAWRASKKPKQVQKLMPLQKDNRQAGAQSAMIAATEHRRRRGQDLIVPNHAFAPAS